MHLWRKPGSCFVKNDNPVLLKAGEANLDIQPVRNYYKALTYMTTYFPKSESEHLESLTHTSWNMEKQKFNVLDAMKKVTYLFISKRRLSVQELVHNVLPEFWIRRCLPGI